MVCPENAVPAPLWIISLVGGFWLGPGAERIIIAAALLRLLVADGLVISDLDGAFGFDLDRHRLFLAGTGQTGAGGDGDKRG